MGVLEVRFHTCGGALVWGGGPHTESPYAFTDTGATGEPGGRAHRDGR